MTILAQSVLTPDLLDKPSLPTNHSRVLAVRNMLIDQDPHALQDFKGRHLLFSQGRGIVEARQDIFPCERGILFKQLLNGIPIGQHPEDLIDRDTGAFNARLPMTYFWIAGNTFVHRLLSYCLAIPPLTTTLASVRDSLGRLCPAVALA